MLYSTLFTIALLIAAGVVNRAARVAVRERRSRVHEAWHDASGLLSRHAGVACLDEMRARAGRREHRLLLSWTRLDPPTADDTCAHLSTAVPQGAVGIRWSPQIAVLATVRDEVAITPHVPGCRWEQSHLEHDADIPAELATALINDGEPA